MFNRKQSRYYLQMTLYRLSCLNCLSSMHLLVKRLDYEPLVTESIVLEFGMSLKFLEMYATRYGSVSRIISSRMWNSAFRNS